MDNSIARNRGEGGYGESKEGLHLKIAQREKEGGEFGKKSERKLRKTQNGQSGPLPKRAKRESILSLGENGRRGVGSMARKPAKEAKGKVSAEHAAQEFKCGGFHLGCQRCMCQAFAKREF